MRIFWACAGLALVAASAWQLAIATSPHPSAARFVAAQLVAGGVYLGAVHAALKRPQSLSLKYVFLIAIASRLVLLPSSPLFDDDIHRYLWDGKVLAHGTNPFLYAPAADELAHLRDANWAGIGYPDIRTIYPPVAQAIFGLAYVVGARTAPALKSVFFLFDMANVLLVAALLGIAGRPRSWAMTYAWSPLVAKECANSGHVEPVMLFFLLLAFYLWLRSKPASRSAGMSFGAALSTKFVPALLAPIAWRLGGWRTLAWAAGLLVLSYLPFAGAGARLFSGAGEYARRWSFNYSVFGALSWAQSRLLADADGLPVSPARLLVALAIIAYAITAVRGVVPSDAAGVMRVSRNVLAVCLLLAPTVDPWYVCWLLPFLAVAPSAGLLVFAVTCNLSYLYYVHQTFPVWIPVTEYAPVCLTLMAEGVRARRAAIIGDVAREARATAAAE